MHSRIGKSAALFGALCLAGCGDQAGSKPNAAASASTPAISAGEPVNILCSFFPIYLFTKNVVGDASGVTVSLMAPAQAGCPHEYDLTTADRKKISEAQIFVMNGGGLEEFTDKQISAANPKIRIVDSSKNITKISDHGHDHHDHADDHKHEKDDGSQHDHKQADAKKAAHKHDGHDHGHDHDHDHHHHGDGNPHFFSSPHQASLQVEAIAAELAKLDPSRAEQYSKNGKAYAAKLKALDEEFHQHAGKFKNKKIVTMHEVFDYLARDLGLEIVDTIKPSPSQDPSAGEMAKLVQKIKDVKPAAIFTEPQYSGKVAETVAKDAGVPVEKLDPVASGPEDAAADYYETVMKRNLETLLRVLGSTKQ